MDDVASFYVDDDEVHFEMKAGGSWEFDGFKDDAAAREFFSRIFRDVTAGTAELRYRTPDYEE